MARPAKFPRWGETAAGVPAANIVEPTEGAKDTGYLVNAIPTSSGLNWLFDTILAWLKWAGKGTPVDADDLANKAYVDGAGATETAARISGDAASNAYTDAKQFPPPTWIILPLNANWGTSVSDGDKLAYCKDRCGNVRLRGWAQANAGAANPIATLPVGCRPSSSARGGGGPVLALDGSTPAIDYVSVGYSGQIQAGMAGAITLGRQYYVDSISVVAD